MDSMIWFLFCFFVLLYKLYTLCMFDNKSQKNTSDLAVMQLQLINLKSGTSIHAHMYKIYFNADRCHHTKNICLFSFLLQLEMKASKLNEVSKGLRLLFLSLSRSFG